MRLDYSERRPLGQLNKNKPKSRGPGFMMVVGLLAALATGFALGFVSGWFAKASRIRAAGVQPASSQAPQATREVAATPVPAATEPSLTFYETLPKGGKAVIGTGLNPVRPSDKGTPSHPAPSGAASADAGHAPAVPAQTPVPPAPVAAPAVPASPAKGGKFCVQVSSSQDRKEAEAVKARLIAKGWQAYVQEHNLKEKGIWYRVRVGKGLDQKDANELAVKAGGGAIVVPE